MQGIGRAWEAGGPVCPGGATFPGGRGSGQRRAHVRRDRGRPPRALPRGSAETRELRGLSPQPSPAGRWCRPCSLVVSSGLRALRRPCRSPGRAKALLTGRLWQVAGQSACVPSREEKVGTRLLNCPRCGRGPRGPGAGAPCPLLSGEAGSRPRALTLWQLLAGSRLPPRL